MTLRRPSQRWSSTVQIINIKYPLPPTASFAEFPMLLLGQHRRGNMLTTVIGRGLRRRGVRGLVYPSARCDCALVPWS
jgi:hypothetical protein